MFLNFDFFRKFYLKTILKMMMILFISFTVSLIPLNENVVISLVNFPDWEITVEQGYPLVRKIEQKARMLEDVSIARIFNINKEYQIDYNGYSLFSNPKDEEIKAKFFDVGDKGFYFQIFISEKGQLIQSYGKCLERGKWNNVKKGYELISKECGNNAWQFWEIRRVPIVIKDNNELNAQVFIHNTR
ncbi:hypothetical protein TUBRATIS_008570 [Tubulinosema ratisbonensis]|uniref:Uncharacterized protein n=1 Tax=Tubulinosema ratisbonensis TaxID=291195 RepID=A0A437ANE3_9MICR|nr:hypothetical protein TUBRATIS_008570 [Tubulinosema ratisbonensis]